MPTEKKHQANRERAALPSLWYEAMLARQLEQEKLRLSLLQKISNALKILGKKYHWDETYLFGSVSQEGKFRRNSDIDIAISGLNGFEHYAFTGEISELLDTLVDVVILEECPFAESIKKKGLKWNPKSGF